MVSTIHYTMPDKLQKDSGVTRYENLSSLVKLVVEKFPDFEKQLQGEEFFVKKWQKLIDENEQLKKENYASEISLRDANDKIRLLSQEPKKALHIFYDRCVMRVLDSYIAENITLREQVAMETGFENGPMLIQEINADKAQLSLFREQISSLEEELSVLRSTLLLDMTSRDISKNEYQRDSEPNQASPKSNLQMTVLQLTDQNRLLKQQCWNQAQHIANERGLVDSLRHTMQTLVGDFRADFDFLVKESGDDIKNFLGEEGGICESETIHCKIEAKNAEIKRLHKQNANFQQTILDLQNHLKLVSEKLNESESNTRDRQNLLNDLSEMEASAQEDNKLLKEEIESWRTAVASATSDTRELQLQNSELEKRLKQTKLALDDLRGQCHKRAELENDIHIGSDCVSPDQRQSKPLPSTFRSHGSYQYSAKLPGLYSNFVENRSCPTPLLEQQQQLPYQQKQQSQQLPWTNLTPLGDLVRDSGVALPPSLRSIGSSSPCKESVRPDCASLSATNDFSLPQKTSRPTSENTKEAHTAETFRCEFCQQRFSQTVIMNHIRVCKAKHNN